MQGALQALDVQDDPQVSDQDPEQVQEGLSAHMVSLLPVQLGVVTSCSMN